MSELMGQFGGARRLASRTALLACVALACLPAPARAQLPVPSPDLDPFYEVPPALEDVAPGTILNARPITALALGLPLPAKAWHIQYRTTDQHESPSAYVATILVPFTAWQGEGQRPLVVYNAVEAGLTRECAISYALRAGVTGRLTSVSALETAGLPTLLARGYAVVTPDFQGPGSTYLGLDGYVGGVLDAVRAARQFDPAAIDPSAPVAMVGYSGGALATVAAAMGQPAYAPDVQFAGIAAGGTPADLENMLHTVSGDPVFGSALPLFLAALDRSFPDVNLEDHLTDAGRAAVQAVQQDCLLDSVIRYPMATLEQFAQPAFLEHPEIVEMLRASGPLTRPGRIAAPVLLYHARNDQGAVVERALAFAQRICDEGGTVHTEISEVGDHFAWAMPGYLTVALGYLDDRLAGLPPPNDCRPAIPTGPPSGDEAVIRSGGQPESETTLPATGTTTPALLAVCLAVLGARGVRGSDTP